jgi:hypothetical protein
LLLFGRFFQRNGAIGRLELSTMSSLCRRSTPMERGCATRRWANAVERRTPSPEREAAISLATCARARGAHAIGAERVARGDAGSLGQHPAEPPAVRSGCSTATRSPLHTTGRLLPPSATLATFAKRGSELRLPLVVNAQGAFRRSNSLNKLPFAMSCDVVHFSIN